MDLEASVSDPVLKRQLVGSLGNSYAHDLAGNRSSSVTNGATTTYLANSVNAYTSISGGGFQPPSPIHDANGNATTYPVKPLGSSSLASCVFAWDINNQQISATVGPDSATYQYDALGRRTQRRETIGGVTTNTWFLTNGWNVELEHDGNDYTKRQTWGLDLSNGLQEAGGVGGLVMVETLPSGAGSPVPSFPTYDGNGNITAWVNASGTVIARQRYDAYGNIIDQFGTAPSSYGFSTKPQEKLTGLLYYGYRYYDPVTGRWPSSDPIEEQGGINLYGFVENDGIGGIDVLGKFNPLILAGAIIAVKAVWSAACFDYAEKKCNRERPVGASDGWLHCCNSCVYNRCIGGNALETFIGGIVHEVVQAFIAGNTWAGAIDDIRDNVYGIISSYNITTSCADSCLPCGTESNR